MPVGAGAGRRLRMPTFGGGADISITPESRATGSRATLRAKGLCALPAALTLRITRSYIQVMRSSAPALLPIFRSQLQADILAALLLDPDHEYSMSDLARRFSAPLSTVHGEVTRFDRGLVASRRDIGRSAMIRANRVSRLVGPLTELLLLSWGPLQVIAQEFASLEGAEQVLIFGSWAARYHQQHGPPPHDFGRAGRRVPARQAVYYVADQAQQRLAIPVNPVIRTVDAWRLGEDPLVQQIQSNPLVSVLNPATLLADS